MNPQLLLLIPPVLAAYLLPLTSKTKITILTGLLMFAIPIMVEAPQFQTMLVTLLVKLKLDIKALAENITAFGCGIFGGGYLMNHIGGVDK
ncbi:hypothetical protein ACFL6S_00735 [Candidatus Poribacteria bacterium]